MLTGALKLFFRELSEPIFPISMNREFMSAIRMYLNFIAFFIKYSYAGEPNSRLKFKAIDELLLRLPKVNRETLKLLLFHLDRYNFFYFLVKSYYENNFAKKIITRNRV